MMIRSIVTFLVLLPGSAFPQTTIDVIDGDDPQDNFGAAVAFIGDLNHDGAEDFAVGAPGDDDGGAGAGSVRVYSGIDRSEIFHWDGMAVGARLGASVDGAGDIDLDGTDDVIAGAPGIDAAYVFSGANGAILLTLAPGAGGEFGTAVCGIGLADGDGVPDLAVGATVGVGLWVFSGSDGSILWTASDVSRALGAVGDIDGDGRDDLIGGDHQESGYAGEWDGRATVYSGATGVVIFDHPGFGDWGDNVGSGVAGVGDVNGDGWNDYAYGAPHFPWLHPFRKPYAQVRSGQDGTVLYEWEGGIDSDYGWAVASAGDMDLDGVPDVVVSRLGNRFSSSSLAFLEVHSGATGDLLLHVPIVYRGGRSIDGGRDVDGDGWPDLLCGNPDHPAPSGEGSVAIYTLGCPSGTVYNYCTALPNSTGVPARMGWMNSTSIASNDFRLFAQDCPPSQFAMFFYGPGQAYAPLGDGFRCVSGPLFRLGVVNTGAAGVPSHTMDFTNPPQPSGLISAGETWFFQLWFRDPAGGPAGSNLADALRATFCP